jgi:hypothetical protein
MLLSSHCMHHVHATDMTDAQMAIELRIFKFALEMSIFRGSFYVCLCLYEPPMSYI